MGVRWDATLDLEAMINEGVRQAYLNPENKLRASIVSDPAFKRSNTRDNTPAVIHTEFVPGEKLAITVAAKGGGSENKSMFAMLNPSDSVADWVLERVPEMGMEAVYEFEVRDMPVTVAVSSDGVSVRETGPKAWAGKFAGIALEVE